MDTKVGILGLGAFLPPEVRHNDWWPAEVVAGWRSAREGVQHLERAIEHAPLEVTPGVAAVTAAMSAQAADPFLGATRRHVMPAGMTTTDMEERAARDAIARAEVDAAEIDLVLTYSAAPEHQLSNPACALHHRLGLRRNAFALHTDGAQHAFMLQLSIAEAMIAAGQARCALLVQSSALSRLLDYREPASTMFGDGATAVVVGRVSPGRGLLASTHRADGRYPSGLAASVRGGAWYDEGRAFLHVADPAGMREVLLGSVDAATESVAAALAACVRRADEVDVFVMHQGMPWLRALVQQHTGLERARTIDTFGTTAHLFAAFVPSALLAAEQQGVVSAGDLVVLAGGGNGQTYGAAVLRWGR